MCLSISRYKRGIDPGDRQLLVRLARVALERGVAEGQVCLPDLSRVPPESELWHHAGAFVTLHDARGELRGCVGSLAASRPLAETVAEMAYAAATRDPRFEPVQPEEVPDLQLEISVLSAPRAVHDLSEVEIGRDGLLVTGMGRRGVLLPQVATENGWDAATFADQTCIKAGLPQDAWRHGAVSLQRFSAAVITEQAERLPSL